MGKPVFGGGERKKLSNLVFSEKIGLPRKYTVKTDFKKKMKIFFEIIFQKKMKTEILKNIFFEKKFFSTFF